MQQQQQCVLGVGVNSCSQFIHYGSSNHHHHHHHHDYDLGLANDFPSIIFYSYIHHCRIFFICSTCHVDFFLLIFHFLPFHFFFLNLAIIITTDFQPIFFYRAPVFCLCVCVCNNRSFFWIKIIIFLAPFFSVINKLATSSDIFRSIYVINFVFVKLFIIIISFFFENCSVFLYYRKQN